MSGFTEALETPRHYVGSCAAAHVMRRGHGTARSRSASATQGASRAALVCGDAPEVLDCTHTSVSAGKGQPWRATQKG